MNKLILAVCLLISSASLSAQHTLFGQVLDLTGNPLPEATVIIMETKQGTYTDADGFYRFQNIAAEAYTIQVSYVGFETLEKKILIDGSTDVDFELSSMDFEIEQVVVPGNWAVDKTPMTFKNMSQEEVDEKNLAQDVPYLLRWTPSVVVTSDAGTGIGYTGIRLRGSDPSRINVTINGVALNDAESQGVFWVDLPDFLSTTESIQIQRGVGTSTNGAGAFGGTINLNTAKLHNDPYGEINASIGSFGTKKANIQLGTGLLNERFTFDGRLSKITSDGYVDRATSDLDSWFLSGTYFGNKSSLRLNAFSGHEVTYQAWNGLPAQHIFPVNLDATDAQYGQALSLSDDALDSLRTFNNVGRKRDGSFHENQVDDYVQTHYQAIYNHELHANWDVNLTGHYTKGKGFWEEFKDSALDGSNASFEHYGLEDMFIAGETITKTDIIRRRWLDNDYYGGLFTLNYHSSDNNLDIKFGGAWSQYEGKHFGEVVWARYMSNGNQGHVYYDNDATKIDFNVFAKTLYYIEPRFYAFADIQLRKVDYEFLGFDENGTAITQNDDLLFINPKLGLRHDLKHDASVYASIAIGNREPNRSDYTESTPLSRPKPERLLNTEIGYTQNIKNGNFGINFYHMAYKDQLVLTGQLNDVGEYTRENVDKSSRLGLELEGQFKFNSGLFFAGNATLSQNKIKAFTEFVDNWDYWYQDFENTAPEDLEPLQFQVMHEDTDLAFSPSIIVGAELGYDFLNNNANHDLEISVLEKYVGKQFLDNTSNEHTALPAYSFTDFKLGYSTKIAEMQIGITFLVRNVLDQKFITNGWTYRYRSAGYDGRPDDPYTQYEGGLGSLNGVYNLTGFFPQAGRNYLLGLSLRF